MSWKILGWMILGLFGIPFLIYLCINMGTAAFYKARMDYLKHFKKGGMAHGEDEETGSETSP